MSLPGLLSGYHSRAISCGIKNAPIARISTKRTRRIDGANRSGASFPVEGEGPSDGGARAASLFGSGDMLAGPPAADRAAPGGVAPGTRGLHAGDFVAERMAFAFKAFPLCREFGVRLQGLDEKT